MIEPGDILVVQLLDDGSHAAHGFVDDRAVRGTEGQHRRRIVADQRFRHSQPVAGDQLRLIRLGPVGSLRIAPVHHPPRGNLHPAVQRVVQRPRMAAGRGSLRLAVQFRQQAVVHQAKIHGADVPQIQRLLLQPQGAADALRVDAQGHRAVRRPALVEYPVVGIQRLQRLPHTPQRRFAGNAAEQDHAASATLNASASAACSWPVPA